MKTKPSPKTKKTDNTDSWPFIRWIESRQRWQVDARTATGGKRTFHETKNEAEGTAAAARILRMNEGSSAFDDRELAKYGWSVQQAIRFTVDHLKKQHVSVPVEKAVEKLIESKKAAGRSNAYLLTLQTNLRRLSEAFPKRPISTITTQDIGTFLTSLSTLAPATKNTIRRDCVNLWSHAEKMGWAEKNVAEKTDMTLGEDAVPEIFTPSQAAALLSASTADVLAFHAIGLFAGLRVSEIKRLDWSDVDLAGGYIHVSAKKSKTRSRRLVPILDALRAWITPVAKTSGPIIENNFIKRQLATRNAAGFKPETEEQKEQEIILAEWPANGMRHSFVSYRLASTNDAAKTALECGHDQSVLFAHYREVVKPKAAERYFGIRPAVAETAPSGSPSEARNAAIRRLETGRRARRKTKGQ